MSAPTSIGKADFNAALDAAHAAAGHQHYPTHCLYLVATPIGNLADISLRALHVLTLADVVACEDTRHTGALLRQYGITGKPLVAVHEHNETAAAAPLIEQMQKGARVVYASDAGTPAVSDPGARLVAACRAANLRVVPLPGASSVTTAISAAGLQGSGAFVFTGFLPTRGRERQNAVTALAAEPRAVVLLEAPHRMTSLAEALLPLGQRPLTVVRELTKQFEQITHLTCEQLLPWLQTHDARGEFVLVLHPDDDAHGPKDDDRVLDILLNDLPLKSAVALAAKITGGARNALYQKALMRTSMEPREP